MKQSNGVAVRWQRYAIAALTSMALLGLELCWTRIFSAEFFYTFAFLVLSLAVMGLGLGAMSVHFVPALGSRRGLLVALIAAGAAMLAGPPLVFCLGLDFSVAATEWAMAGKLVVAIAILASAYFCGGVAMAGLFRAGRDDLPRLYQADLLGAAAGVLIAVAVMNLLSTPVATFAMVAPLLVAAALAGRGWSRAAPLPLVIAALVLSARAESLLAADRDDPAPVIYVHWDATSKIKLFDFDPEARGINIDNAANSPVYAFDGDWQARAAEPFEFGIDVSYLLARNPGATFLSLGAGGGGDVLQALQGGATKIYAVEVNRHINDLMRDGQLSEFSGRIYRDPRVTVVTDDARSYVRRFRGELDLIYSLSSNSFAALASGSFALAENYLFTTEAFADYYRALSDRGFLMMEHQFYMPRLVSAALDALAGAGVASPADHIAVYRLPKMRRHVLLLGKQPLDDQLRARAFGSPPADAVNVLEPVYPAPPGTPNLYDRIVREGWRQVAADAPIDISPATDDRPFVGQLGLWRNFDWSRPDKLSGLEIKGFPLATVLLLTIFAIVAILVLPVTLLPYLRRSAAGPRLGPLAYLYFLLIGAGFMAIEVMVLQKYAVLVGATVYGTTAILTVLLASSGLGSRFAAWVDPWIVFGAVVAWLCADALGFPELSQVAGGLPMAWRIAVAALVLSPLGFFLGMAFPAGAGRVGEGVAWAYAISGVASVLGATGGLLLAMSQGFRVVGLAAALLYGAALLLLTRRDGWVGPDRLGRVGED